MPQEIKKVILRTILSVENAPKKKFFFVYTFTVKNERIINSVAIRINLNH
jgi:hypothetical protein